MRQFEVRALYLLISCLHIRDGCQNIEHLISKGEREKVHSHFSIDNASLQELYYLYLQHFTSPYIRFISSVLVDLGPILSKNIWLTQTILYLNANCVQKSTSSKNLETTADITADSEIVPIRSLYIFLSYVFYIFSLSPIFYLKIT